MWTCDCRECREIEKVEVVQTAYLWDGEFIEGHFAVRITLVGGRPEIYSYRLTDRIEMLHFNGPLTHHVVQFAVMKSYFNFTRARLFEQLEAQVPNGGIHIG
jgi:hypothetical protein